MKLLSDASEYALRAIIWMAQQPPGVQKVRVIAAETQSTPGYLVKVLQNLAKAGILSAQRGAKGGFRLEKDPAKLTALDVINAVDPIERIRTCPLGLESHGVNLCPMHRRIDDAIATVEKSFASSTIQEMIEDPSPSKPLCEGLRVDLSVERDSTDTPGSGSRAS